MRIINTITGATAVTVVCLYGRRIRILLVRVTLGGQGQGENLEIAYLRSGAVLITAVSNPLTLAITEVSAFIGGDQSSALADSQTVATGVLNYNQAAVKVNTALPDCWFPWDIRISTNMATGTVTTVDCTYEIEEIP